MLESGFIWRDFRDAENISDTKNDGVVLDWRMDRRKHLSVFGLSKETGFLCHAVCTLVFGTDCARCIYVDSHCGTFIDYVCNETENEEGTM